MLKKDQYNQLPESLKDAIAKTKREHWGMFFDNEWSDDIKDLEVIEDSVVLSIVFRWIAGKDSV